VAAFATGAGVLLQGDSVGHFRWGTLAAVFGALAVFWVAIWMLDFTYYNRLLVGAVTALTAIERESANASRVNRIWLSIEIEKAVRTRAREPWRTAMGRWFFYGLVFLVLLAGGATSYRNYQDAASWPPAAGNQGGPPR
jgi:hypothetical protein